MSNIENRNIINNLTEQLSRIDSQHVQLNEGNDGIAQASHSLGGRILNWVKNIFSSEDAQRNKACLSFVENSVQQNLGDGYSDMFRIKLDDAMQSGKPISGRQIATVLRELSEIKTENEQIILGNCQKANAKIIEGLFNPMDRQVSEKITGILERSHLSMADFPQAGIEKLISSLITAAGEVSEQTLAPLDEEAILGLIDGQMNLPINNIVHQKCDLLVANSEFSLKSMLENALSAAGLTGEISDKLADHYAYNAGYSLSQTALGSDRIMPTQEQANAAIQKAVAKFSDALLEINETAMPDALKAVFVKNLLNINNISKDLIKVSAQCLTPQNLQTVQTIFNRATEATPFSAKADMIALEASIARNILDANAQGAELGGDQMTDIYDLFATTSMGYLSDTQAISGLNKILPTRTLFDLQMEVKKPQLTADEKFSVDTAGKLLISLMRERAETTREHQVVDTYMFGVPAGVLYPEDQIALETQNTGKTTFAPTITAGKAKIIATMQASVNENRAPLMGQSFDHELANATEYLATLAPETKEHSNTLQSLANITRSANSDYGKFIRPFSNAFIKDFARGNEWVVNGVPLENTIGSESDEDKLKKMKDLVATFNDDPVLAGKVLGELHQGMIGTLYEGLQLNPDIAPWFPDFMMTQADNIVQNMKFDITANPDGTFAVNVQFAQQKFSGLGVQASVQLLLTDFENDRPTITVVDAIITNQ